MRVVRARIVAAIAVIIAASAVISLVLLQKKTRMLEKENNEIKKNIKDFWNKHKYIKLDNVKGGNYHGKV